MGLRATYTVHLRLIEKPVVDFLLVIIELFSLGVKGEVLLANIDWKSAFLNEVGQFDSNFQINGTFPTNQSSCRKTRCIDLSYGNKIWAEVSFL